MNRLTSIETELLILLGANTDDIALYQTANIEAANFSLLELFNKQMRWVKSSIESDIEAKKWVDFESKSIIEAWQHYSKGRNYNSIDSTQLADSHRKECVKLRKKGILFATGSSGSVRERRGLIIYRKEWIGKEFDFSQSIKQIYDQYD